jgi:histo-blood group ABO system transferase
MSVLLMTIATGQKYREYAINMLASAQEFWPEASQLVFTDFPQQMQAHARSIHTDPKGYPNETLLRYHTFLKAEHILTQWEHVFFCDADMRFVAPVGDLKTTGLVATIHPGYIGTKGTPEKRRESSCFCDTNTAYYAGGFQGGETHRYLRAAKTMSEWIDEDKQKGIIPVWHDESAWNKYLAVRMAPEKTLGPEYCYPDGKNEGYLERWKVLGLNIKPILLALEKDSR